MKVSFASVKISSLNNNSSTAERAHTGFLLPYCLEYYFQSYCLYDVWSGTILPSGIMFLCYSTYLHVGFPSRKIHDPPLRHFSVHTAGVFVGSILVSQRGPVYPLGQLVTKTKREIPLTQGRVSLSKRTPCGPLVNNESLITTPDIRSLKII